MTNEAETKRRAEIMLKAKYREDGICTNLEANIEGRWEPCLRPVWNWIGVDYRVIEEPEVFYYDVDCDGEIGGNHLSIEEAQEEGWADSIGILKITVQHGKPTAEFVS